MCWKAVTAYKTAEWSCYNDHGHEDMDMSATVTARKKKKLNKVVTAGLREMAAGEFKAKCLRIMDEINETGRPLVVTKRGVPVIKLVPIRNNKKKPDFFGRLKGIVKIVGDPDDLIKPVFPLDDYDMLK